jgi:hypothetical protein
MLIKEQSSWCFEDRVSPTKGRLIMEVMDLYTDQQFIDIHLKNFLKLNIKRRDLNTNLPFIASPLSNSGESSFVVLTVNLGELNSYPKAMDPDNDLRHVKLELEYLNIEAGFEKKQFQKPWINPTGYTSTTRIDGPTQHEYSIILPKGMKLDKTNSSPKLYYELPNDIGELQLNIKYEEKIEGNEIYHLLINEKDYDNKFEVLKNPEVTFHLTYSASNKSIYIIFFPVFSVMMLTFVSTLFIPVLIQFLTTGVVLTLNLIEFFSILIPQTIVLFPFTYYYLDSRRRDFEVPFNRFTEYVILLSIIVLLFNIVLLSATYLKPFNILHMF